MWAEVAEAAALDASEHDDVLGAVDDLSLVHCQSWAYDHPVDRLAERLGREPAHRSESILAGTSPQRLIDDAATRMLAGRTQVALVVGGEALATRRAFDKAGEPPPWSHPHPTPPTLPVALDEWYLPTELAHGVLPAWLTFALLEQARWATHGADAAARAELHAVIGRLRAAADRNPDAWFTEPARTEDLVVASDTNRMVATPYTKRMTAFMDVDMAAANLVVTKEVADRWQIPEDRRACLRGWGFARDAIHVAARRHLDASPAMRAATTAALRGAGLTVDDIDGFEPSFFGMSPREAVGVDPQQRLLLEVAWEALEHAGVAADQLDGSLTGVFVGITSTDYAQRIDVTDPARSDIYLATGTALNVAAGRIAFTLGLRGPCMAIDTACSSSLVATHAACQSLRDRESNLVLAGGVNVMLSPEPFVLISKWGMLSPDGRCKTFDASANGFVRGEGCGLLVLERLSDAIANGRRVLAVIAGSAINQDGRSSGLTVPNGLAQQEVVRQALAAARQFGGQTGPAGVDLDADVMGDQADDPLAVGRAQGQVGGP